MFGNWYTHTVGHTHTHIYGKIFVNNYLAFPQFICIINRNLDELGLHSDSFLPPYVMIKICYFYV